MYVIAFANPKGGSGKTTSAILLAEQIALSGGRVTILDLDPNANILLWAQSREEQGRVIPFTVQARPPVEDTVELIDKLSGAVGLSDCGPRRLKGSDRDLRPCPAPIFVLSPWMARLWRRGKRRRRYAWSRRRPKMIRAQIAYTLLFTRTNAAFLSADERDVRQEMEIKQHSDTSCPYCQARALHTHFPGRCPFGRASRDCGRGDKRQDGVSVRESHKAGQERR